MCQCLSAKYYFKIVGTELGTDNYYNNSENVRIGTGKLALITMNNKSQIVYKITTV